MNKNIKQVQEENKISPDVVKWLEQIVEDDYNKTIENYVLSELGEKDCIDNPDHVITIKRDYKAGFQTGFWCCIDALKIKFE